LSGTMQILTSAGVPIGNVKQAQLTTDKMYQYMYHPPKPSTVQVLKSSLSKRKLGFDLPQATELPMKTVIVTTTMLGRMFAQTCGQLNMNVRVAVQSKKYAQMFVEYPSLQIVVLDFSDKQTLNHVFTGIEFVVLAIDCGPTCVSEHDVVCNTISTKCTTLKRIVWVLPSSLQSHLHHEKCVYVRDLKVVQKKIEELNVPWTRVSFQYTYEHLIPPGINKNIKYSKTVTMPFVFQTYQVAGSDVIAAILQILKNPLMCKDEVVNLCGPSLVGAESTARALEHSGEHVEPIDVTQEQQLKIWKQLGFSDYIAQATTGCTWVCKLAELPPTNDLQEKFNITPISINEWAYQNIHYFL